MFEVTVRVKFWVATGVTPLVAEIVMGNDPPSDVMPDNTPVEGFREIPDGRMPLSEKVGSGAPVAVTVKVPGEFGRNVALDPDVMAGAAGRPQVADGDAENRLGLTSTLPLYWSAAAPLAVPHQLHVASSVPVVPEATLTAVLSVDELPVPDPSNGPLKRFRVTVKLPDDRSAGDPSLATSTAWYMFVNVLSSTVTGPAKSGFSKVLTPEPRFELVAGVLL